ncbi:MAG: ABC transporter ATP-binding protein [Zavarzinia sp.]|nr:ABC transporter ATP-binding protein [Zavarzinia sp.]
MVGAISLVDVGRSFRAGKTEFRAVDGVSLEIAGGEFVSLLGSSGCGKTTTLRMIAGLDQPTAGKILVDGTDITHVPASHRNMRMMFQDLALFPHLTVADNVAFGLRLRRARGGGLGRAEIGERVARYLDMVRLDKLAERMPHQLSGGQRQRVALARALATEPPIVLFDEPLGALDAGLRRSMQTELRAIQQELGKTFVFVTHDQEEAFSMSDRIAVMSHGRVLQYGSPQAIYHEPADTEVAAFVGTANMFPGHVVAVDADGARVRLANGLELRGRATAGVGIGDAVTVAFRAEAAILGEPGFDVEVLGNSFLGARIEQAVDLGGGLTAVVHSRHPLEKGARTSFSLAPRDVRILVS